MMYISGIKINMVIIESTKHLPNVELLFKRLQLGGPMTGVYNFLTTDFGWALSDHHCFYGTNMLIYDTQWKN